LRVFGLKRATVFLAASAVLAGCAGGKTTLTPEQACLVGAYRLADGRAIDIAPADGPNMRWRLLDGRTGMLDARKQWASTLGWTGRPDGTKVAFSGCLDFAKLTFAEPGVRPVPAVRMPLHSYDTSFRSGDVVLKGRLVMPVGSGPVPILVEVHGSEKDSAVLYNWRQRLFPAQGVGVFVYDKRGTGGSTGKYTQDFRVLARDAAAAVKEARRIAGSRVGRIGFEGGSQGGWIAPLAATMTPVDFVVVGYGLADTPFAENRDEALQDIERFGPAVKPKAKEAIAATEAVMASNFKSGFDRVSAVKAKYGKEPWFRSLKGEFTGDVLKYPGWGLRIAGPHFNVGTPWTYDPLPVLRKLNTPVLWVLAGDDTSAPIEETRRRLVTLGVEGRPITVLEYPRTEHGIMEYEEGPKGERLETGYADGWLQTTLDWARAGRLEHPVGEGITLTSNEAADGSA
jgi:pimeloyl-ACP methyl ester carboxylesterase